MSFRSRRSSRYAELVSRYFSFGYGIALVETHILWNPLGRKPMTNRFLRHVPVVYVDYPAPMSLRVVLFSVT